MIRYERYFGEEDEHSKFLENTFDIDNDVDYIYEHGCVSLIKMINTKSLSLNDLKDFPFIVILSSKLKDEDSIKANSVIKIKIKCGFFDDGNLYHINKNPSKNYIQISPLYSPVVTLIKNNYDKSKLSKEDKRYISNSLNEKGMKVIIAHELSHWISDCLYNKHLTKIVTRAIDLQDEDVLKLRQKNVNLTYFEIDAQIHGIKTLKHNYKERWDMLSFEDVASHYPALLSVARKVFLNYGEAVLELWEKNILKRMARENLLGKSMNNYIDVKYLRNPSFNI